MAEEKKIRELKDVETLFTGQHKGDVIIDAIKKLQKRRR
jgi:hypothetical protein